MSLFPKPFTIKRATKHLGPSGVWVHGTPATLTFYGSVQPLSAFELSVLEVGAQSKGQVWIYTDATLVAKKEGSTDAADILMWQGSEFVVNPAKPYANGLLPHNKYRAELRPELRPEVA